MSVEREVQVTEVWLKTGEKSFRKITLSLEMLQDIVDEVNRLHEEDPDCGAEITLRNVDGSVIKCSDILVDIMPGNFPLGLN